MSTWIAGGGRTGGGYLDGAPGVGALRTPIGVRMWPASGSLMFVDGYSNRVRQVFLNNASIASVIGGGPSLINHLDDCPNPGSAGPNIKRTMALSLQTAAIDPLNPLSLFIPNHMCTVYLNATSNYVSFLSYTNMPPALPGIQIIFDLVLTADGQTMFQTLSWNKTGAPVIVRNRALDSSRLAWDYTVICGFGNVSGPVADGPCANQAKLRSPRGFALDEANLRLYFADGSRIRYLYPIDSDTPSIGTLIGSGTAGYADGSLAVARFSAPQALVLGSFQGVTVMFAIDATNGNVRLIDMTNVTAPVAYTIAGPNTLATVIEQNYVDGYDNQIRFALPTGLAFDGNNTLYVADRGNNKIRQLTLLSPQTAASGASGASGSSGDSSSASNGGGSGAGAGGGGSGTGTGLSSAASSRFSVGAWIVALCIAAGFTALAA